MSYKILWGWRSEKQFCTTDHLPPAQKAMYLRVDTDTVEHVSSVTEKNATDLGLEFDDVTPLGRVYDRAINMKAWGELTQSERRGWIEATIANAQ